MGNTISATLSINETGDMTLTVEPMLSGADAANFSVAPDILIIPDGEAAQMLTVGCTPSITGTLVATLTAAHDALSEQAVYPLRCTGSASALYVYLPLVTKNE